MTRKEREMDESFFVNLGIEKGINEIIKKHPRFRDKRKEIAKHLDQTRLKERVYDIYQNLETKKLSEEKRREYIVKELSDYIATGIAFDEEGKEIILLKGLEEKAKGGFIRGYSARKMLKGEEYLDRSLGLARYLSNLMESGNYQEKMPEIAKAASTLEDMQLLDPLIKIMNYRGSLDEREYKFLQQRIYQKTMESEKNIKKGIEKYIASSILGVLGISLIAVSSGVTGAVVGSSEKITGGIAGIILVIFSCVLFIISSKKKR